MSKVASGLEKSELIRLSRFGVRFYEISKRFFLHLIVGVIIFSLAIFVSVRVVPTAMVIMADSLGIDPLNAPLSGFSVWLLSSLTLIVFIVSFSFVIFRFLWKIPKHFYGEYLSLFSKF